MRETSRCVIGQKQKKKTRARSELNRRGNEESENNKLFFDGDGRSVKVKIAQTLDCLRWYNSSTI